MLCGLKIFIMFVLILGIYRSDTYLLLLPSSLFLALQLVDLLINSSNTEKL